MNIETTRVERAVQAAKDAFWSTIAEQFPEVRSGDFPPDATFEFDTACSRAAQVWLEGNWPEDTFDEGRAMDEGWCLVDVEGRIALQRIDVPSDHDEVDYDEPKFASDAEAIMFVAQQASAGSAYHRDALERIGRLAKGGF